MLQHTPVCALIFVCDAQANIRRVLRDDSQVFLNTPLPVSFFTLFDVKNLGKAHEFWDILLRETTQLDWELNVTIAALPRVFKFSGFMMDGEILMNASKMDEALEGMFDEMMSMNNEQQNMLRQSEKSLSVLKKERNINDIDILEEMTLLNNELVNTQRTLVKQNVEITKLNKQLQRVNAELEQFTYVASHDLREPLRMVTGFMELLNNKYGNLFDEKARSYITFALDGAMRMQKMIIDLLELSRSSYKNGEKKLTNLNDILKEVTENITILIKETGTEIIVKSALPQLPVYRVNINRLFQNLLTNAIKFRNKQAKPVIVIEAIEKRDEWLLSIEDNGIGIEKDKFEKIFEIFSRINSKETYEGSGIGLAICKKIVEQQGGEIWVKSELGKGSIFYFTLQKT